jgi:tellurite resistance protein TerC
MPEVLFPFSEYWWLYAGFTLFVLCMLALDLGVFHRQAHAVSFKEAAGWTVAWISLALVFNVLLYLYASWRFASSPELMAVPGFVPEVAARRTALEFLTGFVIEKSLSVDNIFVFVVVFGYFGVPAIYQHRVLFYGILGALIFRAIFIAVGSVLMQYHWMVVLFGVFLIVTAFKLAFGGEKKIEPDRNLLIRLCRKIVPVTPEMHGQSFFVRIKGVLHATPLFVALLFLEATDVVFAVDSVPAIFALTSEPLIVFTSNIFAILGLRALYFMLAGAMDRFYLLKYGLALILAFVGTKMAWLNGLFDGKFPIEVSLIVIAAILAGSILLSLLRPRPKEQIAH